MQGPCRGSFANRISFIPSGCRPAKYKFAGASLVLGARRQASRGRRAEQHRLLLLVARWRSRLLTPQRRVFVVEAAPVARWKALWSRRGDRVRQVKHALFMTLTVAIPVVVLVQQLINFRGGVVLHFLLGRAVPRHGVATAVQL